MKNKILKKEKPEEVIVEEEILFTSLRAKEWKEFYGQEQVKRSLQIAISSARKRKEALEHVLLYGPPGLGKTTLSNLIAKEMDASIKVTSGPAIERSGDLAAILTNLQKGDVLFIDEIHRLNKVVEEMLYPAMEDYALDVVIGKGPSAKTLRLDLPPFTIIGATTRAGLLTGPLRDRFGVIHRLEFYNADDLSIIVENAAKKLAITIDKKGTEQIAKRGRGTPRIALKLLKRARDFAQFHEEETVTEEIANKALSMLEVDEMGLDSNDRRLLVALIEKHSGGPVGVETLASTISEDAGTIEDVMEPYLMQVGFMKRTPRGRVATKLAYRHLGIEEPQKDKSQQKLL